LDRELKELLTDGRVADHSKKTRPERIGINSRIWVARVERDRR
jgi:hypothetical protein